MKTFKIVAQERPWYGSPYTERGIEARNENSALNKAKKEFPKAVWIYIDGKFTYENPEIMKRFQKANPGTRFYHF